MSTNVAHRTGGASAGASSGGRSCATAKTTSSITARTKTVETPSRVRHSMSRSFRRMRERRVHQTRAPVAAAYAARTAATSRMGPSPVQPIRPRASTAARVASGAAASSVVRREDDRAAGVAERDEALRQRVGGGGVERAPRLVEQEEIGLVKEGARERQALRHAARERAHRAPARALEPRPREQRRDARRAVHTEEARVERQVLGGR